MFFRVNLKRKNTFFLRITKTEYKEKTELVPKYLQDKKVCISQGMPGKQIPTKLFCWQIALLQFFFLRQHHLYKVKLLLYKNLL